MVPIDPRGPRGPVSPLGPRGPVSPLCPFSPLLPGAPLGPGLPSLHWQFCSDCLFTTSCLLRVLSFPLS